MYLSLSFNTRERERERADLRRAFNLPYVLNGILFSMQQSTAVKKGCTIVQPERKQMSILPADVASLLGVHTRTPRHVIYEKISGTGGHNFTNAPKTLFSPLMGESREIEDFKEEVGYD